MVANGQQPVTYGYDAASRLTQVAQGSVAVGLGYDNANRRTSLTYPNGTSTGYTYDVASRLTNINHFGPSGVIEALTYQYDAVGNRTSLTRNNAAASLLPTAVASATYDAANEQTAFAGATLTYDNNGNLTSDGTNTYVWDARNRLIGMSGGTSASFAYDPLGRRVAKIVGGATANFLYDGHDVAAEIGGGAVSTAYLRSLSIDEMFGFLRQDGAYFSIYDGVGSTLTLTNQSGIPAVQYSYEPFGKAQTSNPSFANPFQFTGRENDNTGLMYYRARYYNFISHRFVAQDPITLSESFSAQQIVEASSASGEISEEDAIVLLRHSAILSDPMLQHPYLYGLNNPLRFTDPSGELVPQAIGCVIGAGASVGLDVFSKRKISLLRAGLGCALGSGGGYLASIANANRYLRIGFGRHGGNQVFRLAGQWVQKLTGRAHIDIWKGGPL